MAGKKPFDTKGSSEAQLAKQLMDLKLEQMNLRFQKATGQMEKPNRWREVRTQIAQVKTEMSARSKASAKQGA